MPGPTGPRAPGPLEDHDLAQIVLEQGLLTPDQLRDCYRLVAGSKGKRLGLVLVEKGHLTAPQLSELEAGGATAVTQPGRPPADLQRTPPTGRKAPAVPASKPPTGRATVPTARKDIRPPSAVGRTSQIAESTGTEVPAEVLEMMRVPDYCFDKFVLVEELGKGGMGVVWKAWQRDLKRWVAVKFLTADDDEELQRFCREAQTAARLSHPNICSIYDLGETSGKNYIVMEFIDGPSIFQLGKLAPERGMQVIRDAALAIHYAHESGVIHRDIKPHNVMVARSGRVYVMDFGLAKAVRAESGMTIPGMIMGTPSYMPPEQAEGKTSEIDRRSDVYSLGATLYAAIAGKPPFAGRTPVDILYKVVHNPPPALRSPSASSATMPAELDAVIQRAMQKDPSRRYPTAKALADDLDKLLKGEPLAGAKRKPARGFLRSPAGIGTLAGAAVLLLVALVFAFRRGPSDAKAAPTAAPVAGVDRLSLKSKARPAMDRAQTAYQAALDVLQIEGEKWTKLVGHCQKAVDAAQEALRILPDHEEALLVRGRAQALREDFDAAEADFLAALKADPTLSSAERELGLLCLRRADLAVRSRDLEDPYSRPASPEVKKHIARALVHFTKFAELTKDTLEEKFARASVALAEGRFEEARKAASDLVQDSPRPEYYLLRSRAWVALKKYPEALVDAQEVFRRQRNSVEVLRHLVVVHSSLKELAKALEALEKLLAVKPDDSWALSQRPLLRAAAGRTDEGIRDLDTAIARNPADAMRLAERAVLHQKSHRFKEAIEDATAALKADPTCDMALETRALCYMGLGQYEDCLRDLKEFARLQPQDDWPIYMQGTVRLLMRDYLGAAEALERALKMNPDNEIARLNYASATFRLGKRELALESLERWMQRPPDLAVHWSVAFYLLEDLKAWDAATRVAERFDAAGVRHPYLPMLRARIAAGRGDYPVAEKLLDEIIDRGRAPWDVYHERGIVAAEQKKHEDAVRWYTEALRLEPGSYATVRNRGLSYRALGRNDEAIQDLKKAVFLHPEYARELDPVVSELENRPK